MAIINLRDFYPDYYTANYMIPVPEPVVAALKAFDRAEEAYRRRTYRYHAQYSLDRGDGIEYDAVLRVLTPWEVYERTVTLQQLHAAISALPDKQAKRLYAHFFLGMSKAAIAKSEGVSRSRVCESITQALVNLEKFFQKNL